MVCFFIPALFVSVPQRLTSNVIPWLKSLFKKTDFEHSLSHEEIDLLIKTSRASINLNEDYSHSFRESLLQSKRSFDFEQANENAYKFFYFMLLFTILDNVGATLLSDNFKYVSLLLGFGDSQISIAYFLSTFVAMLSNFACAYFYIKYGLKKTFYFATLILTMDLLIVLTSYKIPIIFLGTVNFTRFF